MKTYVLQPNTTHGHMNFSLRQMLVPGETPIIEFSRAQSESLVETPFSIKFARAARRPIHNSLLGLRRGAVQIPLFEHLGVPQTHRKKHVSRGGAVLFLPWIACFVCIYHAACAVVA